MGKLTKGYVQVYTGNSKGKTTAALGLALRAAGHDLFVYVIQFMKGNIEYGELETARRLAPNLTIVQMGRETFVNRANPAKEDIDWAQKGLALAKEVISSGKYDIVILDEISCAVDFKLIPLEEVLGLIENRPEHVELVLTGRSADEKIIEKADLVTEMKEIKHYFQKGVEARVGIER